MPIFWQKWVKGQGLRLQTLVLKPALTQNFQNNPIFLFYFYLDGNIIYMKDPCILQILTSKEN